MVTIPRHLPSTASWPERWLWFLFIIVSGGLVASLVGWWQWPVVLAVVIVAGVWTQIWKRHGWTRESLWTVVAAMVAAMGFAALRGFYTGDALAYWLPWARHMAASGSMPDVLPGLPLLTASAAPAWPVLLSGVFSVAPWSEWSVAWLPLVFWGLSVGVVAVWVRERTQRRAAVVAAVLFMIATSQSAFWSWNLLVESLLLLLFTLFFYFFETTWRTPRLRWVVATTVALSLAILVKTSSLILVVPWLVLIWHCRSLPWRRWLVPILVALLPATVWAVRNLIIFGNPFYPLANSLFTNAWAQLYQLANPFDFWMNQYPTLWSRIAVVGWQLILTYPLLMAALWQWRRHVWGWVYYVVTALALVASISVVFSVSSGMRYLWPYLGLWCVAAAGLIVHIPGRWARFFLLAVAWWAALQLPVTYSTSMFIGRVEGWFGWLGVIADAATNQWWVSAVVAGILALIGSRKSEYWWWFYAGAISLSVLQTRWIVNKSFVSVWSFVLAWAVITVVIGVISTWWRPRPWLSARMVGYVTVAFVAVMIMANGYAQAAVYFMQHGGPQWPHPESYQPARLASDLLLTIGDDRQSLLLSLDGPEYFSWLDQRPVATINALNIVQRTGMALQSSMTDAEVVQYLQRADVRYVVRLVAEHNDPLALWVEQVVERVSVQSQCDNQSSVCVWRLF